MPRRLEGISSVLELDSLADQLVCNQKLRAQVQAAYSGQLTTDELSPTFVEFKRRVRKLAKEVKRAERVTLQAIIERAIELASAVVD